MLFFLRNRTETGWLKSVTSDQSTGDYSYNLFNIKEAIMAKVCELPQQNITLWIKVLLKQALLPFKNALTRSGRPIEIISIGEYKNGKLKLGLWIILKISSFQESVDDWIKLLKTPRYAEAYAVRDDLENLHKPSMRLAMLRLATM